jgi:hypothetical protein
MSATQADSPTVEQPSLSVGVRAAALRAARDDRLRDAASVLGPAMLAAALCLFDLTSRSLGFDEAASVTIASQQGHALGAAIAHDGGNMSGYYVLLRLLTALFGTGPFIIRLPSVVAIAATAGLTALLGLRLFSRRAAIAAGVLTAVSMPLVFWGQDARGYAPMVALVTASFVAFVALADTEPDAPINRRAQIGYVASLTAAAYFSFVAVLVIPAQLIALAWRRHALRRVGYSIAVCLIFWIPLMVLAKLRGSGQLFWVPRPSYTVFKQVFEALTSAGLQPSFGAHPLTYVLLGVTLAMWVAMAVSHVRIAARPRDERPRADPSAHARTEVWGQAVVLLWLAVPFTVALVESLITQPIFTPRNLLLAVPAASLTLAFGLTDRRLPRWLALIAFVALVALRGLVLAPTYAASPEDWRYATNTIVTLTRPGDCVAFYPLDSRMPFSYYVRSLGYEAAAPRPVFPAAQWSVVKPYVEEYRAPGAAKLRRIVRGCPRLWLVSSHEGQKKGPAGSKQNFVRFRQLKHRLRHLYAVHQKLHFGYAATIHVMLLSNRGDQPADPTGAS